MWLIKTLFCVTCWADIYVNIYTHTYKYLIYHQIWGNYMEWERETVHWYLQITDAGL